MFVERNDALWKEVESLAAIDGLSVYDIEKPSAGRVRVFVHRQLGQDSDVSAESGVSSEDCSRLLRRLQSFFLAEGTTVGVSPESGLEVSSPGVNRKLRLLEQFQSAVGERIKLTFEGGAAPIVGQLNIVKENELFLSVENSDDVSIPLTKIKKASVDFKF